MSSSEFQATAPSSPKIGELDDFTPLHPPQGAGTLLASQWRPLLVGESGAPELSEQNDGSGGGDGRPTAAMESDAAEGPSPGEPTGTDGARSFSAGYELGVQETRADIEVVAESLVKSLQEIGAFRAGLQQRYAAELLELALGVARKVVRSELQARPEAWLGMIRDGIRLAVDREEVRMRVPPVLASYFRERLPQLQAQLEEVKELVIVEDPTLSADGCVIETRFGELDLGVDTQIDRVERELNRAG